MSSFIAIWLIAVIWCVAESKGNLFHLTGNQTSDRIRDFIGDRGFVSRLKAGTYEFQLLPNGTFEFVKFKKNIPGGQTDDITFVLDLDDQDGCKLKYGSNYFLQRSNDSFLVTKIDTTMKYSARINTNDANSSSTGIDTGFDPESERKISVVLEGDLNCPTNDTFALIQSGSYLDGKAGVHEDFDLHHHISCQGGFDDYYRSKPANSFLASRTKCGVGKDVIGGQRWPNEIRNLESSRGSNVLVCRLHLNICVLYKRSGAGSDIFKLQNAKEENKKLQTGIDDVWHSTDRHRKNLRHKPYNRRSGKDTGSSGRMSTTLVAV